MAYQNIISLSDAEASFLTTIEQLFLNLLLDPLRWDRPGARRGPAGRPGPTEGSRGAPGPAGGSWLVIGGGPCGRRRGHGVDPGLESGRQSYAVHP